MSSFIVPAVERRIAIPGHPEFPPPIHAAHVNRHPMPDGEPWMAHGSSWVALCGRRVRVILLGLWDEDREGSCEHCTEAARTLAYTGDEPDWTVRNFVN